LKEKGHVSIHSGGGWEKIIPWGTLSVPPNACGFYYSHVGLGMEFGSVAEDIQQRRPGSKCFEWMNYGTVFEYSGCIVGNIYFGERVN
jgi:hypothetical protein